MIEGRQKAVRKVNETRIKVHETNGDHHGYIEWIEKLDLGYLPVEDRRTMKNERWMSKNGWKSSRNYSRKHYGNVTEAPRLEFSSRKQFSSAISSEYEVSRRQNPFNSFFTEELATQLGQASQVASSRSNRLLEEESGRPKWAWLLFAPFFFY